MHIINTLITTSYPIVLQLKGNLEGAFANQCTELGVTVEKQVSGTLTDKCSRKQESKEPCHRNGHATHRWCSEMMRCKSLTGRPTRPKMAATGSSEDRSTLLKFTEIPWSTDKVWQSTVDKCTQLGLEYKVLSRQQDIDTLSDLSDLLSNPQCPPSLRNDLLHILNTASLPQ